ncbi:MAG: fibronectin type III domain-containing protein [Acidobacteria bacterium]|nr:fibronectin type III domain-containing protein [Acidobacteriota bacterium]
MTFQSRDAWASLLVFLFALLCFSALAGCAAPGEPAPKRPLVPGAIKDLAVRQAGDAVVLTFTLPKNSIEGQPLGEPPAVEIYRGALPAGAAQGKLSTRLVYAIPGALVDTYLSEGRVKFSDPLRPEDLAGQAGGQMVYMVRTRASRRRASADSNVAALRVYPAPERIGDVRAAVTETTVELSWSPPQRNSTGSALGSLAGYRVYRAEVEPGGDAAAVDDPSKAKRKTPLELLGPTPAAAFRDTQFEFGRTYLYTVRSVAQYEADSVESADSRPVVVTPRDVFPPAAPQGLVVVLVPATAGAEAYLELSWSISPETDLAGYHVYRSEPEGAAASGRGERVNRELLLSPTFRDMWVERDRRYTYRVTAVDLAGNESPASAAVLAEVPPREP